MDQVVHINIVSFIRGAADDVLRDLVHRTRYEDATLQMCVLRRMDAVLESSKVCVLAMKMIPDGITDPRAAPCGAAGQTFDNTSKCSLRDRKSCFSQQHPLADCEEFLNGFSSSLQDCLDNFSFRNRLQTHPCADARAGAKPDPLPDVFEVLIDGKPTLVTYEPDSDLCDGESAPLREVSRTEGCIRHAALPGMPDAWIREDAACIGDEICSTQQFSRPLCMREEIRADSLAIQRKAEGLLDEFVKGDAQ